jgi:F-type H+-transporting ATPase subunit epsilon
VGTLYVEIVTPEAALWSGDATALFARSSEGEFAVLAEMTATVGDLVPGVVRVETAGGELAFTVHGGYFQVGPGDDPTATRATVLAGVAERTSDIDVARAQTAKECAELALAAESAGAEHEPDALALARADLARAELRLASAGRNSAT